MSGNKLVPQKWRPSIAQIVVAVLLSVLAPSVGALLLLRFTDFMPGNTGTIELATLALAIAIALVLAFVLIRTLTAPISGLSGRAHAMTHGGREALAPLPAYGTRETAKLAENFFALAGRLLDRSDYIQSIATHVTHEFKSPLTSIKGAAELLLDDPDAKNMNRADRLRFLNHIVEDVEKMSLLLARLRELGRAESAPQPGATTVAQLEERLNGVYSGKLVLEFANSDLAIPLGPDAAEVIFRQLAANAIEHGATKLHIRIDDCAPHVEILISDNGSGVPSALREQIFEPFFTTRREDGGTGMGLQIVRTMAEAHSGTLTLEEAESGAAFKLSLPTTPT